MTSLIFWRANRKAKAEAATVGTTLQDLFCFILSAQIMIIVQ